VAEAETKLPLLPSRPLPLPKTWLGVDLRALCVFVGMGVTRAAWFEGHSRSHRLLLSKSIQATSSFEATFIFEFFVKMGKN